MVSDDMLKKQMKETESLVNTERKKTIENSQRNGNYIFLI